MSGTRQRDQQQRPLSHDRLWYILVGPVIWAIHFLVVYIGAAVICEKVGTDAAFGMVRTLVAVATAIALGGIGYAAWRAYQRWDLSIDGDAVYDDAYPTERYGFLSQTALMLAALSAIAVIFDALPAVFIEACRP